MYLCLFPTLRSLMSQIVSAKHVGKIFSAVSIVGALIPFVSNPIYR